MTLTNFVYNDCSFHQVLNIHLISNEKPVQTIILIKPKPLLVIQ